MSDENGGLHKHFKLNFFKNITVSQMFRVINQKLKKRDGLNGVKQK